MLSLGTEETAHNNEVCVKWVSTVIRLLFGTIHALLQCQDYFISLVYFCLDFVVEE